MEVTKIELVKTIDGAIMLLKTIFDFIMGDF